MARSQAGLRRDRVRARDAADDGTKQDVAEQRGYYADLTAAIATARAAGLADGSSEMTTLVGSMLHSKYGAWRRFDEFLALNVQGMIAWRAGKSPAAH